MIEDVASEVRSIEREINTRNLRKTATVAGVLFVAFAAAVAAALFVIDGAPETAAVAPPRSAVNPMRDSSFVLFAVGYYNGDDLLYLEPITWVHGGKLNEPPSIESGTRPSQQASQFVRDYYDPSRQFRVLFGGADAGTISPQGLHESGCTYMMAKASWQSTARIGGVTMCLAADSTALTRDRSVRRAPTDQERAAALDRVTAIYLRNGVPRDLVAKMKVRNLTATDLDGDGVTELVGSFEIEGPPPQEYGDPVVAAVFLVATVRGSSLEPSLEWFNDGKENVHLQDFVDQVDLDGDGVAEIVTNSTYYEHNDYTIYKRQGSSWVSIYRGGGSGC
jgi:hypothetical protein